MTMCLICDMSTVAFPGSTSVIFGSTDVFYASRRTSVFCANGSTVAPAGKSTVFCVKNRIPLHQLG